MNRMKPKIIESKNDIRDSNSKNDTKDTKFKNDAKDTKI